MIEIPEAPAIPDARLETDPVQECMIVAATMSAAIRILDNQNARMETSCCNIQSPRPLKETNGSLQKVRTGLEKLEHHYLKPH